MQLTTVPHTVLILILTALRPEANQVNATAIDDAGNWVVNHIWLNYTPFGFSKSSPTNGATGVSTNPTLSWGASSGATSYEYCYNTSNDNACSNWINNGASTSVGLSSLDSYHTYYWHVRAINSGGTTYSNASTTAFWSFTTIGRPTFFSKTSPLNGATDVSTSPSLLWGSSSIGATSYEYCIDRSNNNSCDEYWTSVSNNRSVDLVGLGGNTTYYWQVRARNEYGTTEANDGMWYVFLTELGPPGYFDKIAPLNGSDDLPLELALNWEESPGFVSYYEYCYDITDDNLCDGSWINVGTNTSANITGLNNAATYYWQVRCGKFTRHNIC